MDGWMDGWVDGCKNEWIVSWTDGWRDGNIDRQTEQLQVHHRRYTTPDHLLRAHQ